MNNAHRSSIHVISQSTPRTNTVPSEVNYAFLVHSQDSLGLQNAPEVDNQSLARQRRRRTSPEDHAILEAEYRRNPKPDKATRFEIVRRVALGEKEVQIWFQNRRQLARRKSQPSGSHEISFNSRPTLDVIGTEHTSSESSFTLSQPLSSSSQSSTHLSEQSANQEEHIKASIRDQELSNNDQDGRKSSRDNAKPPEGLLQTFKMDSTGAMRPREPADKFKPSSPSKRRPGYLANRRSAPFIIHEDGEHSSNQETSSKPQDAQSSTKEPPISRTAQPLRRTASLVKLSLDAEGKAEVTPRTGDTPSPPGPRTVLSNNAPGKRGSDYQRSFSAVEPGNRKGGVLDPADVPLARRQSVGRSRDARTWEFYCDGSARNALTKQAEREESGSAAAAIGLLRTQSSNNKFLTGNPTKRNAHVQKLDSAKRHKTDEVKSDTANKPSKPKLTRAVSSLPRLQTTTGNQTKKKMTKTTAKHSKSSSQSAIFEDLEGDSDKENWQPGTQRRPLARQCRPVTTQESARILLESLREPSKSSSVGRNPQKDFLQRRNARSKRFDKENAVPDIDDEVAELMGEELPREEEDLDCVQNLLRLSQAAWD